MQIYEYICRYVKIRQPKHLTQICLDFVYFDFLFFNYLVRLILRIMELIPYLKNYLWNPFWLLYAYEYLCKIARK